MTSRSWALCAKGFVRKNSSNGQHFHIIRLFLSHWVFQMKWFWRHVLWICRSICQGIFENFDFWEMATNLVQISGDFRTKIEYFYLFFNFQDISFEIESTWKHQNGPSYSQNCTFQTICGDFWNFHFFRKKMAKFALICSEIGPYGPKNENFKNRRI